MAKKKWHGCFILVQSFLTVVCEVIKRVFFNLRTSKFWYFFSKANFRSLWCVQIALTLQPNISFKNNSVSFCVALSKFFDLSLLSSSKKDNILFNKYYGSYPCVRECVRFNTTMYKKHMASALLKAN